MNDGVLYDPSVLALVERRKSGFRVQKNSENENKSPFKDEYGNPDDSNDQQTNNQDGGEAFEANNDMMEEKKQDSNQNEQQGKREKEDNSGENDPVYRVKRSLEFTKNDEGMKNLD